VIMPGSQKFLYAFDIRTFAALGMIKTMADTSRPTAILTRWRNGLLGLLWSGLLLGCSPVLPTLTPPTAQPEAVLVALEPTVLPQQVLAGQAARLLVPQRQLYAISLPAGAQLAEYLAELNRTPGVRFAEAAQSYQVPELRPQLALPDLSRAFGLQSFVPNDPEYGLQWNLRDIGMEQAWELAQGAPQVTVAVIDSGVDPEHPDLLPHLLPLEDVWGELGGDDVLVGRFSRVRLDFKGKDGNGHGTHVAGIIAAVSDNATGVAGIAGAGVKILPIKVTNLIGTTNSSLLIEGLRRAIAHKVDVINMSIGTLNPDVQNVSRALQEVIELALEQGITVVAASGNESNRRRNNIVGVTVPAAYPGVIAVGASTAEGQVANYSNGGPELDLLAPGGQGDARLGGMPILSTWPTYPSFENLQRRVETLEYAFTTGTSMAAPHVSGVAALLLAREPGLTPAQVRARLIATAADLLDPGHDSDSGYGKLNAFKALQAQTHDADF